MNNLSLKPKLIFAFCVLGIVPFLLISGILLSFFTDSMQEKELNHLVSVRNIKKAQISEYFTTLKHQSQYFVGDGRQLKMSEYTTPSIKYLKAFSAATHKLADTPQQTNLLLKQLFITNSEDKPTKRVLSNREYYDYTHEDLHPNIKAFIDKFGYEDLFLVKNDGNVVYSVKKSHNFGNNLLNSPQPDTGLAKVFLQAQDYVLTGNTTNRAEPFFFSGFAQDKINGSVSAFISIPLFYQREFYGVVIFEILAQQINVIMAERAGLGVTGETYLVDEHYHLRSAVYRAPELFADSAGLSKEKPIKTASVIASLAGKTEHKLSLSYLNDEVLSAYTPVNVFGQRWALLTEITTAEAYSDIYRLSWLTLVIALLTLCLIVFVGMRFAFAISAPVIALTRVTERIAAGDLKQNININVERHDELGRLASSFAMMRDAISDKITEIEQQNVELIRLDQLKDNLLANTTHELKTPLNGIIGLSESLIGVVPAGYSKTLDNIIASGRRLSHLVDDILDAARLKHKEVTLRAQPLNLRQIVDFNNSVLAASFGDKALIAINLVPQELCVLADQNRLLQILQNLVGNAIKFSSAGEIRITAKLNKTLKHTKAQEQIEVSICDNGIGIPAEDLQRIFLSFEQSDASASRNFGGTGLGLAITQQLVTLHGGTIWAESQPGAGATFTFTLPVSHESSHLSNHQSNQVTTAAGYQEVPTAQTATALQDQLQAFNSISTTIGEPVLDFTPTPLTKSHHNVFTVLVVDDEPINLQVVFNHFISVDGYSLVSVGSGSEALAVIAAEKPDLVLLDVMMPKMDGYQVCKKIRESYTLFELPVIFLTARNQTKDLIKGFAAGGNDYLAKPFCKEELMARVSIQMDIGINRERIAKLRMLSNKLSDCDSHETVMNEAYNLCLSDPVIEDVVVFFGGEVQTGNKSGIFSFPEGLSQQAEILIKKDNSVLLYHNISDFYALGVKFAPSTSEEWLRTITLQISSSIKQIRKISANPDNALLLSDILPYIKQILYIQVEKQYCSVVKVSGDNIKESLIRIPFKQILFHIEKTQLLQVHRSYAVNPDKIVSISGKQQQLMLENQVLVPIAKKYVRELEQQFPHLCGVLI